MADEKQRVVTVHVAIECLVNGGDASPQDVGMMVVDTLPPLRDVWMGPATARTWAYPREVGLISCSEKYVNPSHDQVAS